MPRNPGTHGWLIIKSPQRFRMISRGVYGWHTPMSAYEAPPSVHTPLHPIHEPSTLALPTSCSLGTLTHVPSFSFPLYHIILCALC